MAPRAADRAVDAGLTSMTAREQLDRMIRSESLRLPSLGRERFRQLPDRVFVLKAWRLEYREIDEGVSRLVHLVTSARGRQRESGLCRTAVEAHAGRWRIETIRSEGTDEKAR